MGWPDSLAEDVEAVCTAAASLMDDTPPAEDCYQLVIQLLDNGYGGLEHDHGAVLQFAWPKLATADGYHQLLQLVGHEYLHQWNVRRLRPKEYVPYDHGSPVVSGGLWFAEGVTSYFDLALPLLAGRSDRTMLLKDLSKDLAHVCSIQGARFKAWLTVRARPGCVTNPHLQQQTHRSVITGSAPLAFCLDVELRLVNSSLAQVLRDLWATFGRVSGLWPC